MNSPRSHDLQSNGHDTMANSRPGELRPGEVGPVEIEPGPADATLRLIATLPAPEGLEDRVHTALRSAPRGGRLLAWPSRFATDHHWARGAAAAAIAFVVVGGGWGVYSRVQPNKVIAMPRVTNTGGFSGANAVRVPQTLNGPVLTHPAPAHPVATPAVSKDAEINPSASPAAKPATHVVPSPSKKKQPAQDLPAK